MRALIVNIVGSLISIYMILLIIRSIVSWIPSQNGNSLYSTMVRLTEPVVSPFRTLVNKIPQLRNSPIDVAVFLSFLFLYVLLRIIRGGI